MCPNGLDACLVNESPSLDIFHGCEQMYMQGTNLSMHVFSKCHLCGAPLIVTLLLSK